MKRLTSYINTDIQEGEITYPAWTIVQVINEYNVPEHHLETLNQARKFSKDEFVMCIIGTNWIPIKRMHITERY